ncbi:MAG TPA: ABC transporter ATP-binding protein [Candidatus Saccharimonadales bacterium]|nr:ABC transporter ATP-binding protein [Candidatus Saccharimonadales bacterium]
MLQVTNLRKVFNAGDAEVIAVDNVSMHVGQGEFVSIVGRSGSGKTTLMSLLGSLEKPTSGTIEVDGQSLTTLSDHALNRYRGQKIGFVFQSYNLVPNLTALENVMLPMEPTHIPRAERKNRAQSLLNQVGLTGNKQRRRPGRLSGGEQQRVAIARSLANKPAVILADEPTGNLDSATSTMIITLLRDLSRSEHTTIIVVTHDNSLAMQTDRMFRLQDGQLQEER